MPRANRSPEHIQTVSKLVQILEKSGFSRVDSELNFRIGPGDLESGNLDACAIYGDAILCIEVKTGTNINFRTIMRELEAKRALLADYDNLHVDESELGRVRTRDLRLIRHVGIVLLFTEWVPSPSNVRTAKGKKFPLWNNRTVRYYSWTSDALGPWTKFEIMFDSNLQPTGTDTDIRIPAIEAEQPGGKYYLCAMNPADLLRIGYVFRRSKMKTMAYQRIVRPRKIESMAAFIQKTGASVPNNVIMTIDPALSQYVHYDHNSRILTIPGSYCSAWIVDGQHRLYGFARTRYEDQVTGNRFRIPVVVFKQLDTKKQTAMFVDINSNQKSIDPTLLADLSTVLKDLSRKETWPSMLGERLNETGPFRGLISIYEIPDPEDEKPISLAGFSKYALTKQLLTPRFRRGKIRAYAGPLFQYAPFDWTKPTSNSQNRAAMQRQVELLNEFFSAVSSHLGQKWTDSNRYAVTNYTGTNALLLVLNKILESGQLPQINLYNFLTPLGILRIPWTHRGILRYSNFPGFKDLANKIIRGLNATNPQQLTYYEVKRGRRR